jgi:hypothetical protein
MLESLAIIVKVVVALADFVLQQQRKNNLKDIHNTMLAIKAAKTDEERRVLAEKIASFWANPR